MARSHTFSRPLHGQYVLSFDWFAGLPTSFVIAQTGITLVLVLRHPVQNSSLSTTQLQSNLFLPLLKIKAPNG